MKFIKTLRLFHFIHRLAQLPSDTTRVFDIVDYLILTRSKKQLTDINQRINRNPQCSEFLSHYGNRKNLQLPIDYLSLSKYDKGTLGQTLYQYYISQDKSPSYYTMLSNDQPITIIRNYLARTHDIWHILTGFGNSDMEEYGLQAAYLAQESSMAAFCIMCGGVYECIKKGNPIKITEFMKNITKGYIVGSQSKLMLYIIWDDYFDMPIEEVRNEFQIAPFAQI